MPILKGAHVDVIVADISDIRVTEFQVRYPERLMLYIDLLTKNPEDDLGVLLLKPVEGGYELIDGHHRFLAYIMRGRKFALALKVDESHLHEQGTEDQGAEQGLRHVVAEALGVDERSTSIGDLRTKVELRRAVAEDLLNAWQRINVGNSMQSQWPELYIALMAFENEYL